ncbi:hypothetical protein ATCC90586_001208 [Pythium insidiosum]|nr:hypothetical protein ATCC90586_001208 [Pythium insidiosum]
MNAGVLPAPVPAHCYKRALNDGVARVSFAAIRRPRPPPPADDAAVDGDEEDQVTRVKRRRCDDTSATANVGVDAKADADAGAVVVGGVLAELDVIHRVVHIQTLAVGAGDRRRGIGRRLVERVIAETRARLIERGVTCVQLHVHVANDDAIAFYMRLGFHEHQRLERYYRHLSPPACLVLRFPLLDTAAVSPRDHDVSPSAPHD